MKRKTATTTIHLKGKDASNFFKSCIAARKDADEGREDKNIPVLIAMNVEREKLIDIANAADTVMHYFVDSHFNEDDFRKMIAAMEPLRVALIAASYDGGAQETSNDVAHAKSISMERAAFLRGVMYALAEFVSEGESTVRAVEIANASGTWEDFIAVNCCEYDLRRFARKVGQQGIRSLRADRGSEQNEVPS